MDSHNKHIDPLELLPKYFAKETSTEENLLVENWMADNTGNKKEFDAFAKLWNAAGSTYGLIDIDIDVEWKKLETAILPAQTKTFSLVRVLQIAASVVFISSLAFIGYNYSNTKSEKAPLAELKIVKLPDGSTISLNAGSKISYRKGFGKTHRNMTIKGEAYFEVEKNKALPFVISANEASIEVVGTKFNVKAYPSVKEIKVLVTEGTVKLFQTKNPSNKTTLVAGESGSYAETSDSVRKSAVSNLNDIAWKTLVVDFNNTNLLEVAGILENTYHVPLEIDPKVQNCLITVHFEKQDLVSILKVLKSTLDLKITTENDRIKITGSGCE
jgi:transmembrane sensor